MRIVCISPYGFGDIYHGPGRFMRSLYTCEEFSQDDIVVLTGNSNLLNSSLGDKPLIQVISLNVNLKGKHPRFTQLKYILKASFWLIKNRKNIDVIQAPSLYAVYLLPLLFGKMMGIKCVGRVAKESSDLGSNDKKHSLGNISIFKYIKRKSISWLDAIVAISSDIEEELSQINIVKEQISYIPNGVDIERFFPKKTEIDYSPVTILFCGGVEERKGAEIVAEAVLRLWEYGESVKLIYVGPVKDKELFDNINYKLRAFATEDNLSFIGFVNDTSPWYNKSDIFCLPSSAEGMPNALLEAMSSGLAVIGTNISGIKDIIEDRKNGILIERNTESLFQALLDLLKDSSMRRELGVHARKIIEEAYSINEKAKNYRTLYFSLKQNK